MNNFKYLLDDRFDLKFLKVLILKYFFKYSNLKYKLAFLKYKKYFNVK
jgi:hypothetical protein